MQCKGEAKADMRMDHEKAPLFEAMVQYQRQLKGNFHVPGHKQGQAFDQEGVEYFSSLLQLDVTEVEGLDDLHDATGVIAEAQRLAANAFGADHTFFLVGGTTAGNLATFLSLCQPGDEVIVQRSSHQSIFHGCWLARVKPIYIGAEIDQRTGFEKPLEPKQIRGILQTKPNIKGVWITSPSYFGVNQPISAIAAICRQHNVPLIVDEAHGAHYTFCDALPPSAMQSGADLAVQSTHKMLPSMTMSSMMHIKGKRISVESLRNSLRVIESSSPSYPLMASLDLARRYMMREGRKQIVQVWKRLSRLRQFIEQFDGIDELVLQKSQDPFKLSLVVRGYSGFSLSSFLHKNGLYPELADERKVLLVFSVGSTQEECDHLRNQLVQLVQQQPKTKIEKSPDYLTGKLISEAYCSYDDIQRADRMRIPLKKAIGKLAAEMIIPYPPGIPFVLPGEVFTSEIVEQLDHFIHQGGTIRGIGRDQNKHVYVLK